MRYLPKSVLTLLAVWVTGYGLIFGVSELRLRDFETSDPFEHPIPGDATSLARGKHIARTRGCFGCHGQQLQGRVFTDQWSWVERAVAPNLASFARLNDSVTLERSIRQGVGHDGRALWSMPSYNYRHLSDVDTAALIAFLRQTPVISNKLPEPELGFRARWLIATGSEKHMADQVRELPELRFESGTSSAFARGEYLAMTTCNECHGLDLRGATLIDGVVVPDLAIVAAYSEADFLRLMKQGVAISGNSNLGLMTMVARDRFAYFDDQELSDLYRFLQTLPNEPIAEDVPWRS